MQPDSHAYFTRFAGRWDEIRSGYFTEHMRDAAIAAAGLYKGAIVADIGTGTGFVAAGLAPLASKVYGIDANPAMLEVATRNLASLRNVEFLVSTGDRIPLRDNFLDAAFANMYLHHAPEPAAAIREMVRLLQPGGVLCLTDLDSHDHEWQREQMADLWLGFERTDIRDWFAEAGLEGINVDCAEGTCTARGPDGEIEPLSIFVARARKK